MKVGDYVLALYDEQRGIPCVGLILSCSSEECVVRWSSPNAPSGSWKKTQLKVINESR